MICLDSFLFLFTFLPIRFFLALFTIAKRRRLSASQLCDVVRVAVVAVASCGLFLVDSARMFHYVRGQAIIKLYVIFNGLEILDKLFSSFGVDVLDALFGTIAKRSHRLHLVMDYALSTTYVCIHIV